MRQPFTRTIIIFIILCNNLHAQWDNYPPVPISGIAGFNSNSNLFSNNDIDISNRNGIPLRESNFIDWGSGDKNYVSNGNDIICYTWAEARDGAMNVFAQLYDLDGNTLLPENGLQLTDDQWAQKLSSVIYAGQNQWIIGWYDFRQEADCGNPLNPEDRLLNTPFYYLQKIDQYGNLPWGLNPVALWDDPEDYYIKDFVPDETGGCFVVWEDLAEYNYSGQHINTDGELLWPIDGVLMTDNYSDMSNILIYNNELYYGWKVIESRLMNIYAQKMTFDGQKCWGDNGIYLSEGYDRNWYPQILKDGNGGIFISWYRENLIFAEALFIDIYLQHLDTNGTILFNDGGICLEHGGGYIGFDEFSFLNTAIDEFVYSFQYIDRIERSSEVFYQKFRIINDEIILGWEDSNENPKLVKQYSIGVEGTELYSDSDNSVVLAVQTNAYDYTSFNSNFTEIHKITSEGLFYWQEPLLLDIQYSQFSSMFLDDHLYFISSYHTVYNATTTYLQAYSLITKNERFDSYGISMLNNTSAATYFSRVDNKGNKTWFSWVDNDIENSSMFYIQCYDQDGGFFVYSDNGIPAIKPEFTNPEDYSSVSLCDIEIMNNDDIALAFINSDRDANGHFTFALRCQRINTDGDYLWQQDGITIYNFDDNLYSSILFTETDDDESLLLFYDVRSLDNSDYSSSIRMQKITSQGEILFPDQYGKLISEDSENMEYKIRGVLNTNVNGSAIVYSVNNELRLMMIDSDGNQHWTGEAILSTAFQNYSSRLGIIKIKETGENLTVVWRIQEDDGAIYLYGQKVDIINGSKIFQNSVKLLSDLPFNDKADVLIDESHIWTAWASENDVFLHCHDLGFQLLNDEANSKLGWSGDFKHGNAVLIGNGQRGAYLIIQNGSRSADLDYFYFEIDSSYLYDNSSWNESPDTLINMYAAQYDLSAASDGKDGFFYIWNDTRVGTRANRGNDVYCGWLKNSAHNTPNPPPDFRLYSPYPNPFNQYANIQYDIPERAFVEISIYNLLGQRITILKNMVLEAGHYSDIWDGKSDNGKILGSGIYFISYKYDNLVESKKIVFLK